MTVNLHDEKVRLDELSDAVHSYAPGLPVWDAGKIKTPNIVRQGERLLGVSASSPNDAWAVGNTNMISLTSHDTLAAHWDGTAWTKDARGYFLRH